MRRFEFVEGTSSKFWQVAREGTDLHVSWGKIGTGGQTQLKSFSNASEAEAALDKLVQEKTRKGYVEVTAGGAAKKASAPAAPSAPAKAAPAKNEAKAAPPKNEAKVAPPPAPVAPTRKNQAPEKSLLVERVVPASGGPDRPEPTELLDEKTCLSDMARQFVETAHMLYRREFEGGLRRPQGAERDLAARFLESYAGR